MEELEEKVSANVLDELRYSLRRAENMNNVWKGLYLDCVEYLERLHEEHILKVTDNLQDFEHHLQVFSKVIGIYKKRNSSLETIRSYDAKTIEELKSEVRSLRALNEKAISDMALASKMYDLHPVINEELEITISED